MNIRIPENVGMAVQMLEDKGFEAYLVGGCVRDSLLGRIPHDWDICTNALPEQTKEVFDGYTLIESGLKHGTVGVVISHKVVEITTYRTDGEYHDHRRPDEVCFVRNLGDDLARRDFTINAMCLNHRNGLVDLYGGEEDLRNGIIRCVGEPEKRFEEDALRILRALRFASRYGFEIEKKTSDAIHAKRELLREISAERIFTELKGLLCGREVTKMLLDYRDVIAVFIPEITPCFDFKQNNPHHIYDVWKHIAVSVGVARPQEEIRLSLLMHDIGKPLVATVDEKGINHFKTHQYKSAELSLEILRRLKCDKASKSYIHDLIYEHDNRIAAARKSVKKFISKYSYDFFMDYLEVRRADTYAQSMYKREQKLAELDKLAEIAIELNEENACMKLSDLCINGRDVMALGLSGRQIGDALRLALEAVVDERAANDKDELIKLIKENI